MRRELIAKIMDAIMPEDIREKCLKLVEKCPEEMLQDLSKSLEDYFEKRKKELALILKNDRALAAKMQKKLLEFENKESDSDAEDFLNSTAWQ